MKLCDLSLKLTNGSYHPHFHDIPIQLRSRTDAINNLIQLMDRLKAMCKNKDHTNFHSALVNYLFRHSFQNGVSNTIILCLGFFL